MASILRSFDLFEAEADEEAAAEVVVVVPFVRLDVVPFVWEWGGVATTLAFGTGVEAPEPPAGVVAEVPVAR